MDGHEREDVVKYRNEVYLPAMLKYERRMVQFEGPELTRVEPTLQLGEKRIKPYFHDECCFHANDNVNDAWYVQQQERFAQNSLCCYRLCPGERVLRKKGRGRLIHVSDFINEEDGRLVSYGPDGKITKDARRIIYPGANGDTHDGLMKTFSTKLSMQLKSTRKSVNLTVRPYSSSITHLLMHHCHLMLYVRST